MHGTIKRPKFGDRRDDPSFVGPRSTMPARQRNGSTYAGGKSLRKAMARLADRQKAYASSNKNSGQTKPGSMKA